MSDGLRLGKEQERRLRAWPKDRIRPKSVALGVISLLAEVDALRAELGRVVAMLDEYAGQCDNGDCSLCMRYRALRAAGGEDGQE